MDTLGLFIFRKEKKDDWSLNSMLFYTPLIGLLKPAEETERNSCAKKESKEKNVG
jgi:hypothetical protein